MVLGREITRLSVCAVWIFWGLLPLLGSRFQLDERWHFYMTALIVPVAMIALVTGWMRHRKNLVMILGVVSLSMILGAHPLHEVIVHIGSEVVGTLGGCILITAHLFNHKFLHSGIVEDNCCCCH